MKVLKNIAKIVIMLAILIGGSVAFSAAVDAFPVWDGYLTKGTPARQTSYTLTGYFPQEIRQGGRVIGYAYCDDAGATLRWGQVDRKKYYPVESMYKYGVNGIPPEDVYNSINNIRIPQKAENWVKNNVKIPAGARNRKDYAGIGIDKLPAEFDYKEAIVALMDKDYRNLDAFYPVEQAVKEAAVKWMERKFRELSPDEKPDDWYDGYDIPGGYSLSYAIGQINSKGELLGPKVVVIGDKDTTYYVSVWSKQTDSRTTSLFDDIMNTYILNGDKVTKQRTTEKIYNQYDVQTASWLQNDHEGWRHGYNADGSGTETVTTAGKTRGTTNGKALYAEAKKYYEFNEKLKAAGKYENMLELDVKTAQVFTNRVDSNRNLDEYIIGPITIKYPEYTNISYLTDIKIMGTGDYGKTTLSYASKDFEITTMSNGEWPKDGEMFWIRVNAKKLQYAEKIAINPEFEYVLYSTAEYNKLEGSGGAQARIYTYKGHLLKGTRKYKVTTSYEVNTPVEWITGPYGIPIPVRWEWITYYKWTNITFTIYQAYVQMDLDDYETKDEQEIRTVGSDNTNLVKAQAKIETTLDVPGPGSIDLKIKLEGYTWVDGTAGKESEYNGKKGDTQDTPMSGVKVILHQRKPDGQESEKATTTTDANGHYGFDGLNALYTYYVEFKYNGQYYQPTIYKANGVAWNDSSKGNDILSDRDGLNAKFAEIGSNPKNYSGGEVYTRTYLKEKGLIDDFGNPTGSNQYVNDCMISAYTGYNKGSFTKEYYPVYSKFVIADYMSQVNRAAHTKDYQADFINIYNLLYNGDEKGYNNLFINQGFVIRETVDLALHKDVYNATIEIKDKSQVYKYNKNDKLSDEDFWDVQTQISDAYLSNAYKNAKSHSATSANEYFNQEDYTREIYKEDYNFKASSYQDLSVLGQSGITADKDELRIYVTYKITVRNQSDAISSKVMELVDYYDKEYTLIESSNSVEREQKYKPYLGNRNGTFRQYVTTSSLSRYGASTQAGTAEYKQTYITGFDNILLDPDNNKDLYLYITFRVNNDNNGYVILDESVADGNTNGYNPKRNIVEINGYKTFYTDRSVAPNANNDQTDTEYNSGDVAGLVDIDSVAGNVSPDSIPVDNRAIDTSTFEDDTSKGPNIRIRLNRENARTIDGTVFEDERTVTEDSAQIGNGIRDDGETGINGVTVQLVELFKDSSGNYKIDSTTGKPLEYIWRTVKSGDKLTQSFIIDNPAITNVIKTYNVNGDGEYLFKSFAPGDYIVRFIYGDGTESVLGTKAVNYETGVREDFNPITDYFEQHGFKKTTENNGYYSVNGENIGLNENSYNGQDYKSTTYQLGVANGEGAYTNTETATYKYDFDASSTGLYSDAKDIYSRRLEVNNASSTITNHMAEVLSSFEYLSPYYNSMSDDEKVAVVQSLLTEFINTTKMTAETGVMNIELEYNRTADGDKNGNYTNVGDNIGGNNYDKNGYYDVANVDFGLAKRPQSQLKTTKQIANVKVTLANGNTLFDASKKASNVMWIDQKAHGQDVDNTYEIRDNYHKYDSEGHSVSENNTLVKIPVVRNASAKGRVQLTMDVELMHGSTIQITYMIMVANVGEVDFSDAKFYYTGQEDNANSNIVKTKVETLVDYVGAQLSDDSHATRNNLQFNAEANGDWEVATFDALKNDGLLNSNLSEDAAKYTTIIKTKDSSTVVKELVPVLWDETNSKRIDDKWNEDPLKVLDAVNASNSVTGVKLVLSQTITSDNSSDDLTYNNITELVKSSSISGRRMAYSVAGNQSPVKEPYEIDADSPQEVVILPPFGQSTIYYILGIAIGVILLIGISVVIIVTKKKKTL